MEHAAKANNWTDSEIASQVTFAMEGKPLTWIRAVKEEDEIRSEANKISVSWKKLKVAFLERFQPISKTMEKRRVLKALQMTDKETPREFLDRCKVQLYTLKAHVTYDERMKEGWKSSFDDEVLLTFIGGLKEEIRNKIEEDASLDDLEKVLKTASGPCHATKTPSKQPPTGSNDQCQFY